ncbi:MAG: cytochrome c biogenesis protein ResB [Thermoleophilia bacterium]
MNRVFRLLRSTTLALVAMAVLALVVAAGSLIPQRLKVDPGDYASWKTHLPALMGAAEALGLTDVYHSPLYVAAVALFAINLTLCTWKQIRFAARRLRPRTGTSVKGTASRLGRADIERPTGAYVPSALGFLQSGGRVVAFLEAEGYSVRSLGPGRWEGRRRWVGHVGLPLFHVALLLVIIGALAVSLFSFRGNLELAEGQGFVSGTDRFLQSSRGLLGRTPPAGLAVRLDAFRSAYHQNGQIAVRESDISIRAEGVEEHTVISSSHPAGIGDYRVYQSTRFGWAALLRLNFPDGREQEGFVNLAQWRSDEDDTVKSYRSKADVPGTSYSVLLEYERPVEAGVGSAAGSDLSVSAVVSEGMNNTYNGRLAVGESIQLPGGVEFTYVDLRPWSGVVVVGTPGLWLVYLGGALGLLGLLVHLVVVPESIRVSSTEDGDAAGFWMVGWRRRYQDTYQERLHDVALRLETALQTSDRAA